MKIQEPAPNLVKQEALVADRIANIAVPATSSSIWDAFKEQNVGSPVSYRTSGGFNPSISEPASTTSLKSLQMGLMDSQRYKLDLPQLAGPAQRGIATARQKRALTDAQYAVEGGTGAAAVKGNTQFVDDKGWGVTLKQILGSRMLSPEQLRKASIQNVQKIVTVQGGSAKETQELQFMFQRMMLEGFVRGVDITKEMEKQGGLKVSIDKTISGKTSVIGVAKSGTGRDTVQFGSNWWNNHADADKYTLFIHEVGHSLLNAAHENNSGLKKKDGSVMTPIYNGSVLKNYNGMLNELFTKDNNASITKIGVKDNGGPSIYDPSWYPSLTDKPTEGYDAGVNTPAGTSGGGSDGDSFNSTSTTNNSFSFQAVNASVTAGGGSKIATANSGNVAVQPMGQQSPSTMSFAAGMANLSQPNPNMMQEAGAILKSG